MYNSRINNILTGYSGRQELSNSTQYTLHVDVNVLCVLSLVVFQFDLITSGKRVRGLFDVECDFIVVYDSFHILGGQRLSVFQNLRVDRRLSRSIHCERKKHAIITRVRAEYRVTGGGYNFNYLYKELQS